MQRIILITCFFIVNTCLNGQGLRILVTDSIAKTPISNALVQIAGTSVNKYTKADGLLEISNDELLNANAELKLPKIIFEGSVFSFLSISNSNVKVYNISGIEVYNMAQKAHRIDFSGFVPGIYIFIIENNETKYQIKAIYTDNKILGDSNALVQNAAYTISVTKEGYQTLHTQINNTNYIQLKLAPVNFIVDDYLAEIDYREQFQIIESTPLNPYFGDVTSVKFIYEIKTGRIYYINSQLHTTHSFFAISVLNYHKDNNYFNLEQYHSHPNRLYYPGTIDYFKMSGKYVLQFFASDDISCEAIGEVYEKIKKTCYFSNALYFYANTIRTQGCHGMELITSNELFNGQNYQCLNPESTFGYVRKVDIREISNTSLGRHDLILLNGIPVDLPVVAGIITTEFQTPLSHINVLSINRKTPNMVLRNGWSNADLLKYENKLVFLKTSFEKFEIREATYQEAQLFWDLRKPATPFVLSPDTLTSGLIELPNISIDNINLVGGKAINFGEMAKISGNNNTIPLPEGAFAIPFFYYHQHMKEHGLYKLLEEMLTDELFKNDISIRKTKLKQLRDKIKSSPANPTFIALVEKRIGLNPYKNTRFRSSTNAEDIDGFNGAGLYESATGIPGDVDQTVEKAIKKVWASLWNFSAFEEREYFKINQRTVAMGILAHRSFDDEKANGVLITKNIYREGLPAFTINCQFNEISVVNPEEAWQPEQILYYTFPEAVENPINYLNYSNVPGYENLRVLTEQELRQLHSLSNAIVEHYWQLGVFKPLDIEFKIELDLKGARKLYIKQCRIFNN